MDKRLADRIIRDIVAAVNANNAPMAPQYLFDELRPKYHDRFLIQEAVQMGVTNGELDFTPNFEVTTSEHHVAA